jgi:predicted transcriptional regulator
LTATPTQSPAPSLLDRIRTLAAEGVERNHVELVAVLRAPSDEVAKVVADEIAALTAQGRTRKEIAAELGLRVDTVRRHARERGIEPQPRRGPIAAKAREVAAGGLPAPVLEALERVDSAVGRAAREEALEVLAARVRAARDLAKE